MIVHDIGKIIGGIAIGFNQDHIVQLRVVHSDVPIDFIMEGSGAFRGIILTDDTGNACCQLLFHLFLGEAEAVFVIDINFLPRYRTGQGSQPVLVAETVIGFPFFHKLFRIFQIESAGLAFTLDIRADASVLIRAFVMSEACLFQGSVNDVHSPLHKPFLIRIFNTQNEIAALMLGD